MRRASGRPLLEMAAEPELFEHLRWIWNAWNNDLIDCRVAGMGGAVPLSWSECSAWCRDHGVDGAERMRFIRLVRALDREWCRHMNKPKGAPSDADRSA